MNSSAYTRTKIGAQPLTWNQRLAVCLLSVGVVVGTVILGGLGTAARVDRVSPEPQKTDRATPEQKAIAQRKILAEGYKCEHVDAMMPFAFSGRGWHVFCGAPEYYRYELEDHGGKWSVTAN
jgi:hypothetical protein